MNMRYIFGGLVVLLLVGAGGYFLWKMVTVEPTPPPVVVEEQPPAEVVRTYASSTLGLSVQYPPEFSLNDAYEYQFTQDKAIQGIKFTIPESMATGTNLSSDSGVSVEWLPNAHSCSADIYLLANVKAQSVTDEGREYSLATSTDAGAGNLYEEIVYALPDSSPCIAVRYFIHSTQIANYPEGTVREFDREALLGAFDKIRRSLTLSQPAQ